MVAEIAMRKNSETDFFFLFFWVFFFTSSVLGDLLVLHTSIIFVSSEVESDKIRSLK